ncbi:hypothetical protein D3C87_1961520 [compost metagenome]
MALINGPGSETDPDITVTLNGVKITSGLLENGTTFAPVRAVAEALGAKVSYDAANRTVNLVRE